MKQYNITGMSCAACANRIEKTVAHINGVDSCSVSLLTNSMGVEGTASSESIIQAIENIGYGASEKGVKKVKDDSLVDHETPKLKKRLITSPSILNTINVFIYGSYDVEMACTFVFGESCISCSNRNVIDYYYFSH